MKPVPIMVTLLFCTAVATVSASARSLDEILSTKEIRVGVNPEYPPTARYNAKNELEGYDIDLSNRLGEMLGVKVTFVTVNPSSRVPFVTSGKIDYVLGGMTRTPERAKLIDFTVPITTETLGVLTVEGKQFEHVADLNKETVTLAEVRGTTPVKYIQQALPKAKLLLLDNHPDVLRAVAQGRADAVIDDLSFLGQISKTIDAKWMALKENAGEVDYDCLGVNKGDQTLKNWLNTALFSLEQDGFMRMNWRKWYGFDMVVPVGAQPYF
jgi:polar amino acid transport system substrate-binding protein